MRKFKIKEFAMGIIVGGIFFSGISYAESSATSIGVYFQNLEYYFDGYKRNPPNDQQGFIYNGTAYVPLRFIAQSLHKEVSWDESTSTIRVGALYDEKKGEEVVGEQLLIQKKISPSSVRFEWQGADDNGHTYKIYDAHGEEIYLAFLTTTTGHVNFLSLIPDAKTKTNSPNANNDLINNNKQPLYTKEQALKMLSDNFEGIPAGIGRPRYEYAGTTTEGYYIFHVFAQGGSVDGVQLGTTYFDPTTGNVKTDFN